MPQTLTVPTTGTRPDPPQEPLPPEPFRLLWANAYCLLDTSSGASMAVREMLHQLARCGVEIEIIGATVFDAPTGLTRIQPYWPSIQAATTKVVQVEDPPLQHQLVKTTAIQRGKMTAQEEATWFAFYRKVLDARPPDLIFFYGGQVLDLLIADEAKARGIPCVAYLANGSYQGTRWCRDVNLVLTNSQATARMYQQRLGIHPVPTGGFINHAAVIADHPQRQRLLFINPVPAKGVALVIRLALALEERRPDILLEVVESRCKWDTILHSLTTSWATPRTRLNNVIVTPNTKDMRPVYARARVLLAPSLWWEAFGRVAAEAMLNGIPAIVTQYGGLPEVIGNAGLTLELPDHYHRPPYRQAPSAEELNPVLERIERWFDDEAFYQTYVQRAYAQGEQHRIEHNTQRLLAALAPLILARNSPSEKTPAHTQPTDVQSVLLHSFMGGARSMGRVGHFTFEHLMARGYEVHFLPFRTDYMAPHWAEQVQQRRVTSPKGSMADQQVTFCSVLEAQQRRYARHLTPWFFHDVEGLPADRIDAINRNDAVYVTSTFVRDLFVGYGVKVPVQVLGHGFDPAHYRYVERTATAPFTFLCVAEPTARKNLGMLLRAFGRAFGPRRDVRLVMKTALHDAGALRDQIQQAPNVILDTRRLHRESDLVALYQQAHCFVLPSRCEGFGMPYLEAMATGLPVIATHYSGHLDFCRPDTSYLIEVKRMIDADTTCFPHLAGLWAEPDEDHLIALMRGVVEDYDRALEVGRRAHAQVTQAWTWQAQLDAAFPGPAAHMEGANGCQFPVSAS